MFKAHGLLYHSTLGLRVMKKIKRRVHTEQSFYFHSTNQELLGTDTWC